MDKLVDWWYGLEPREQIIVAVGAVVVALGLIFFVAINPLLNWQEREHRRLEQTIADAGEVRQLVARVKARNQASQAGSQTNKGLSVLIDNTLRENELVMRGFQPGKNNDARLRLENAAYSSLAQWLYDLEYRHGVSILDMSLTPAKVSGRLMVSLRVSQ